MGTHALMWLPAFDAIAKDTHMRLLVLGKPDCPASLVTVENPTGIGSSGAPYVACNNWHTWAVRTIDRLSPSILVVSQDSTYGAPGPKGFTPSQWHNGLAELFKMIPSTTEKVFLGNIPLLSQSGPTCLSIHLGDAQACSTPVTLAYRHFDETEFSVATTLHVKYIDPTPWFCSAVCTAIVGPYGVYMDQFHVSAAYATYLQNALAQELFGSTPTPTFGSSAPDIFISVVRPSNGATLSGGFLLDARSGMSLFGKPPVVRVVFRLSGGGLRNQSICSGASGFGGWICYWNTSSVANGRYTLQSVAYDAAGMSVRSKSISLSVKN